ncbi:MAG: TolC family protein, partial [Treponema sp.]|nr:TolC family protein [Treponema sp.]
MNLEKTRNFRKTEIVKQKKPKRFFAICLTALMLLCTTLPAQEAAQPMRLSPDEAVELALKNNLSLESSRTSLDTRRRASQYSWNQFIPNVTVAGVLSRDNEASTSSGITAVAPTGLINNPMIAGSLPPGLPQGADIYLSVPYSVDVPQWHVVGSLQTSLNISAAMFENMRRLRLDYEGGLL